MRVARTAELSPAKTTDEPFSQAVHEEHPTRDRASQAGVGRTRERSTRPLPAVRGPGALRLGVHLGGFRIESRGLPVGAGDVAVEAGGLAVQSGVGAASFRLFGP